MKEEEREHAEIIKEFLASIDTHLRAMEQKVMEAAASLARGGTFSQEDWGQVSQAVRTIYSAASLAGLQKTVDLTHAFGSMISGIKPEDTVLTRDMVEIFGDILRTLKTLFKGLKEEGGEVLDIGQILSRIKTSHAFQMADSAPAEEHGRGVSAKSLEIDEKYLEVYLDDTEQNIEHFNYDLVSLEKSPANVELINNLFRLIHTIKGSSGMVNVSEVQDVAHAMESILAIVRDKKEAFPDMFPLLFEGIDTINEFIRSLRRRTPLTKDVAPLVKKMKVYIDGLGIVKKDDHSAPGCSMLPKRDLLETAMASKKDREALRRAVEQKNKVYKIVFSIDHTTPIKSLKVMLLEEHLKNKGAIIVVDPRSMDVDDFLKGDLEVRVLFATVLEEKGISSLLSIGEVNFVSAEQIKVKDIKEMLSNVEESSFAREDLKRDEAGKKGAGPAAASAQAATIRIDAHKLDTLMNLSGELVTVRAQFERLVALLNEEISSQSDFRKSIANVKSIFLGLTKDLRGLVAKRDEQNIKKILKQFDSFNLNLENLERLTGYSNLVNEIHAIDETTDSLGKIASDIQAAVMQARMVPIKGVFTRFNRIVRDISRDTGKDVDLVLEGEETELDKNLVDNLGESLTHMIRNAMDHGIEDAGTRQRIGKPEKGTILLRASHEGNNICIDVRDDGKGLDPDMLARSALKKRLITEEQMNRLTDQGKLDLVFLPGFSTAAKVTDLSGRGVGMDVVRNMISALNGSIDIFSEIGKGTDFILKIPLTLAIIQSLLVVVDGEIYALPLEAVTEIIKVTDDMIYSIDGNDTVKLREQVLSLIELRNVIHVRGVRPPDTGVKRVVVVSDGDSQVGIIVDRLVGETEIVIKSLSHHFFNVKGISGVTILGDGQLSLILDPKLIIMKSR
jgi:two-component system chemotaxis sensor kinase CheA